MKCAVVFCVFAVTALFTKVTFGQIECMGKPDGAYGFGCKSYTLCKGGNGRLVDCGEDQAFNYETKQCEPIVQVPQPCGKIEHNCATLREGKFAIKPDCKWFYTCSEGRFLGASPCNNPQHTSGPLVFDEKEQLCKWPQDVLPPCGTNNEATEVTSGDIECMGKPDGAYGFGCRSYMACKGGKGKLVHCVDDQAFNHETKQCEPIDKVPQPCGKIEHNCATLRAGKFAIKPDCKWFYTCSEGRFLGASPCNVNGPLVFDEKEQLCNWPHDVLPPCGTKKE